MAGLTGDTAADELEALVRALPDAGSVAPLLASLAELKVER